MDLLCEYPEANWELDPKGIQIRRMDVTQVTMIDIFLSHDAFESFQADETIILCINALHLSAILKASKAKTKTIVLSNVNKKNKRNSDSQPLSARPDMFHLQIEEGKGISCLHEIRLLDVQVESLDIPETTWDYIVTLKPEVFETISKSFIASGNDCCSFIFTTQKDQWEMSQDKTDEESAQGDVRLVMVSNGSNSKSIIEIKEGISIQDNANSVFLSLEMKLPFLLKIIPAGTNAETMKIYVGALAPMMFEYDIEGFNNSFIRYYIAPTMPNED